MDRETRLEPFSRKSSFNEFDKIVVKADNEVASLSSLMPHLSEMFQRSGGSYTSQKSRCINIEIRILFLPYYRNDRPQVVLWFIIYISLLGHSPFSSNVEVQARALRGGERPQTYRKSRQASSQGRSPLGCVLKRARSCDYRGCATKAVGECRYKDCGIDGVVNYQKCWKNPDRHKAAGVIDFVLENLKGSSNIP